jgi:chromosome segregation ATPase
MRTRIVVSLLLVTAAVALTAAAGDRLAYVYKHGDRQHIHASGAIDTAVRISKKWAGDFIWASADGREYVIRDAAVLAQANEALVEVEAFEPAMRAAEKRMKPFEDRVEEIERQSDELSDQLDDDNLSDAQRRAIEAKLHEVEDQMRTVEDQMRGVEKQLDALEKQMDAREDAAETRLEQIITRAIRSKPD